MKEEGKNESNTLSSFFKEDAAILDILPKVRKRTTLQKEGTSKMGFKGSIGVSLEQ